MGIEVAIDNCSRSKSVFKLDLLALTSYSKIFIVKKSYDVLSIYIFRGRVFDIASVIRA